MNKHKCRKPDCDKTVPYTDHEFCEAHVKDHEAPAPLNKYIVHVPVDFWFRTFVTARDLDEAQDMALFNARLSGWKWDTDKGLAIDQELED